MSCRSLKLATKANEEEDKPSVEQPDKMDFSDLCQCYFVFKAQRPGDFAQLCFQMLKLTKDQPVIGRDDLTTWVVRIL